MRGKYSPATNLAYARDQDWWRKFAGTDKPDVYVGYDPEGYDSYGYDVNDVDRAGNHENDYAHNDGDYNRGEDFNDAYNEADYNWGFDGTKPVRKNP